MRIFIDTSAFYALLDKDDYNHSKARKAWPALIKADNILVTTNYVLIESFAPFTAPARPGCCSRVSGRSRAPN